jgi:hypothetical protein
VALTATSVELEKVVEKELAAIAVAVAELKSNGKNCSGAVTVGTATTKDTSTVAVPPTQTQTQTQEKCAKCVTRNEQCAGKDDKLAAGCCSSDDLCVRRSANSAVCKRKGAPSIATFAKSGFGQVLTCSKA